MFPYISYRSSGEKLSKYQYYIFDGTASLCARGVWNPADQTQIHPDPSPPQSAPANRQSSISCDSLFWRCQSWTWRRSVADSRWCGCARPAQAQLHARSLESPVVYQVSVSSLKVLVEPRERTPGGWYKKLFYQHLYLIDDKERLTVIVTYVIMIDYHPSFSALGWGGGCVLYMSAAGMGFGSQAV